MIRMRSHIIDKSDVLLVHQSNKHVQFKVKQISKHSQKQLIGN